MVATAKSMIYVIMQQLIDIQRPKENSQLRSNDTQQQSRFFESLQNKPFWIWNVEQHKQEDVITNGLCCFNHIIGLPKKEGEEKAIFDYEKILYYVLLDNDDSIHASFKHKDTHLVKLELLFAHF